MLLGRASSRETARVVTASVVIAEVVSGSWSVVVQVPEVRVKQLGGIR